jgi:hypothetical protein
MKFTKDDKMKYLVVEYSNGNFYGFNLVDVNERLAAKKMSQMLIMILLSVDGEFQKKNHLGLYRIRNGKDISFLVKLIMMLALKLLLLVTKNPTRLLTIVMKA